jgi:hypothetical protein
VFRTLLGTGAEVLDFLQLVAVAIAAIDATISIKRIFIVQLLRKFKSKYCAKIL